MMPVQAAAETGKYRLELDIGDPEQMYSKADSRRRSLKVAATRD
jgi:hypothetical protein